MEVFSGNDGLIFGGMVFLAVVTLLLSVVVPTVGTEAQANRRMKQRIGRVLEEIDSGAASLLREHRQGDMSAMERSLMGVPAMGRFVEAVHQAGMPRPATTYLVQAVLLFLVVTLGLWFYKGSLVLALLGGLVAGALPLLAVVRQRALRLSRFEEQLPEALEMMARALQAGHPFNETLKMIGEEMSEPISTEFRSTFNDISYGLPAKSAYLAMLGRVPSMNLQILVSALLVQQESGGKLAEILQNIARIIRSRFKLNRKVRALSAEGRMSAWVLTLLPFVLAVGLVLTTPSYLPMLTEEPEGRRLVVVAFLLVMAGNIWMRKIIRIKY